MILSAETIVTGSEVLRPGWIHLRGERVVAVGAGDAPAGDDQVQHLGDVSIVPGFVDTHVHGGGGADFSTATADAIDTATGFHLQHGTTAMMASLVSAHPDDLLRQVSALTEHVQDGRLAGIHLEGPWLSPLRCGAHDPTALRPPDAAEINRLLTAGGGAITMVTLAPELTGGLAAVRRIVEGGAVAAIGHTEATYEQTRAALDAGATVATHLFNAMRPVHQREPGPVVAMIEDPRVVVELIADGLHLHPALHRAVTVAVGPDRAVLVTDAMAAAGMPDGRYRLGDLNVDVTAGRALVAGTDTIAGSTATMDQLFRFALANAPQKGNAALLAAVRQTSLNPARAHGLPRVGLSAGSAADLVVLDGVAQVSAVMQSGRWVRRCCR